MQSSISAKSFVCSLFLAASVVSFTLLSSTAAYSALVAEQDEIEEDPWAVTDVTEQTPKLVKPVEEKEQPKEQLKERPSLAEILRQGWKQSTWSQLKYEVVFLIFALTYTANIFVGRRKNARIARAWGNTFCLPDGVFAKNFAQVGTGEGTARLPMTKESGSEFTLYCSGRRHSRFLKATLDLKRRQDLFCILVGLFVNLDDKVDIEVVMNEASMPQIVLAIATKKLMKSMLRAETGEEDIRNLARKMEVSREKAALWASDKLAIYAEHSSIFYDIITDTMMDQIFSKAAMENHGQYFRLLHFTSEQSFGPKDQRCILRFSFRLPAADRMEELSKLMSSVGTFIDLVGNYKLSPDMKKRAEKLRQDMEKSNAKDKDRERQEALEERRMAKRAEEQEKLRRMTPDQREKYEQRKAKIESGRQQRKFTKRA